LIDHMSDWRLFAINPWAMQHSKGRDAP